MIRIKKQTPLLQKLWQKLPLTEEEKKQVEKIKLTWRK